MIKSMYRTQKSEQFRYGKIANGRVFCPMHRTSFRDNSPLECRGLEESQGSLTKGMSSPAAIKTDSLCRKSTHKGVMFRFLITPAMT